MAGAGHFEQIGSRLTFVPPFVNERFDGPPFWACTYTALLNGANVGWLGQKPATHAEVAALAGASGDSDTRGGSRSSHMVRALETRYKINVSLERCSQAEAQRRLANGYALVAGVTFGELPTRYRRWSPKFKLGHRVTVIGWSAGRTRILDPLAAEGPNYAGEWITWSDFAKAWWSAEQLWFQEGQFLSAAEKAGAAGTTSSRSAKPAVAVTARILRRFDPARNFRVAANTKVTAFAPGVPRPPFGGCCFPMPAARSSTRSWHSIPPRLSRIQPARSCRSRTARSQGGTSPSRPRASRPTSGSNNRLPRRRARRPRPMPPRSPQRPSTVDARSGTGSRAPPPASSTCRPARRWASRSRYPVSIARPGAVDGRSRSGWSPLPRSWLWRSPPVGFRRSTGASPRRLQARASRVPTLSSRSCLASCRTTSAVATSAGPRV